MPSTVVQKLLLVLSICLICLGLGLTISGTFSPAWQHGLWWDCVRSEKHVVAVGDFYDETPLHCMYKFDQSAERIIDRGLEDPDQDGAIQESFHHQFRSKIDSHYYYILGWHQAVLFFIISSQILALISLGTGICAPCFHPTAYCFTLSLFIALIFSVIANGIFFFAANSVDTRFVTGMVGTYEQRIGYAFYLHLGGTLAWLAAFLCAIATTYKFISSNGTRKLFEPDDGTDYRRRPELSHVKMEWQPGAPPRAGKSTGFSTNLANHRERSHQGRHSVDYSVMKQNMNENPHLDPLIVKTELKPRSILQNSSNNTSYNNNSAPTPPPRGYYRETMA